MENWKLHLLVVTFCALVQNYQAFSVDEDRGLSENWQDEPANTGLTHPMAGLMKRAKALRFYGLMGKRSAGMKTDEQMKSGQFKVNRRNKGEMFVGLMGRSITNNKLLTRVLASATTTAPDVQERPHEQENYKHLKNAPLSGRFI